MGIKDRIMETLDHIQKLTIPRSEDWEEIEKKKAAVKEEENPTRLALIYNILRETVAGEDGETKSHGINVQMPDGSVKTYSNYEMYKDNIHKDLDVCFQKMRSESEKK